MVLNIEVILFYGKFEGKGKFTFEDGEYYIGEFLNGNKNGKGTDYYKDNKVKYDGYFVNNEF